ncbi:MAG: sulfurtransferase [Eudoraea sp.]|uniref:sulfurtransferase n=1 Tax=Eudoraea sp. TaxID=1979955 RepID=UPI003C76906C
MTEPIVSSIWLYNNLEDPDLIVLDASPKIGKTDFKNIGIKGARKFDLQNEFSDTSSELPNTLPSPKQFENSCKKLGITNSSKIVVYDNLGIYISPRVWWMFKVMGHQNIAVLNGGLPEWIRRGYETLQHKQNNIKPGNFEAKFRPEMVKYYDFVLSNVSSQESILIDARSPGRFKGIAPEPREGLPSGHIPASLNLPYTEVLEHGKYKSKEALEAIFNKLDVNEKPLVFSCGSGVTACIILLASEFVLKNDKSVYDGSWTEWAQIKNK